MKAPRFEAKALKALAGFFLAAILSAPAWADVPSAHSAQPGTLNYVEGHVSMGSQSLNAKSIGTAELQPGQSVTTGAGKAEVLLTPGVFLRVGNNSSVRMISPSITETEVGVDRGHAMIEVAEIHPENDLLVTEDGATTRLLKTGLYDFDQRSGQMRVFDGKAAVVDNAGHTTVKGGREVSLAVGSPLKARKFDKKGYFEDDLYRWSSLRSAYEAEANVDAAGAYYAEGYGPWGPGWWGADWYWDPWFDSFAFIPGDGIFFSPFGWGFYSPWWVGYCPLYYGFGFGGVGPYHPYYHHFSENYHNWGGGTHYLASRNYTNGIYRGPGSIGGHGFHSGPRMVSGLRGFGHGMGGFHGGEAHAGGFNGGGGFHGGGFHGGGEGFGGGFHGGGGGGFHGR